MRLVNMTGYMVSSPYKVLLLLMGFAIGYLFYSKFMYRVGGVIVTPLLALYTLSNPIFFFLFLAATFISYATIEVVVSYRLIYGRRLFYVSCFTSGVVTFILVYLTNVRHPLMLTILPGIFAYNLFSDVNSVSNVKKSLFLWSLEFSFLLIIGYLMELMWR